MFTCINNKLSSDSKRICLQCRRPGFDLDQEDPLKKRMAIHSRILAWRILWTEEPSQLQSMGPQRDRTKQLVGLD